MDVAYGRDPGTLPGETGLRVSSLSLASAHRSMGQSVREPLPSAAEAVTVRKAPGQRDQQR